MPDTGFSGSSEAWSIAPSIVPRQCQVVPLLLWLSLMLCTFQSCTKALLDPPALYTCSLVGFLKRKKNNKTSESPLSDSFQRAVFIALVFYMGAPFGVSLCFQFGLTKRFEASVSTEQNPDFCVHLLTVAAKSVAVRSQRIARTASFWSRPRETSSQQRVRRWRRPSGASRVRPDQIFGENFLPFKARGSNHSIGRFMQSHLEVWHWSLSSRSHLPRTKAG